MAGVCIWMASRRWIAWFPMALEYVRSPIGVLEGANL
jgi:hypothetical protein